VPDKKIVTSLFVDSVEGKNIEIPYNQTKGTMKTQNTKDKTIT